MRFRTVPRTVHSIIYYQFWNFETSSEILNNGEWRIQTRTLRAIQGTISHDTQKVNVTSMMTSMYHACPENRVAKRVFLKPPLGRRPTGWSWARWGKNLIKDAQQVLKIRSWKKAVSDRNALRRSIEEVIGGHWRIIEEEEFAMLTY